MGDAAAKEDPKNYEAMKEGARKQSLQQKKEHERKKAERKQKKEQEKKGNEQEDNKNAEPKAAAQKPPDPLAAIYDADFRSQCRVEVSPDSDEEPTLPAEGEPKKPVAEEEDMFEGLKSDDESRTTFKAGTGSVNSHAVLARTGSD